MEVELNRAVIVAPVLGEMLWRVYRPDGSFEECTSQSRAETKKYEIDLDLALAGLSFAS